MPSPAGADSRAEHKAMVDLRIEPTKLNGVIPLTYLTNQMLETLVDGFPAKRIDDLLPWN